MIKERSVRSVPGIPAFFFLLALVVVLGGALAWYAANVMSGRDVGVLQVLGLLAIIVALFALLVALNGLTIVHPNEARALVLFGRYAGSLKRAGPLVGQPVHPAPHASRSRSATSRARSSRSTTTTATRSRSRRSSSGASPTPPRRCSRWTTTRTSSRSRREAAIRNLATSLPLRRRTRTTSCRCAATRTRSASELQAEIQARLEKAGVEVIEAAHQPPRLRPRDRERDAPPPAGERGHRRPDQDRRGRGEHGRDGARPALHRSTSSSSTRSARRRW